ncbi:hypothetical protein GIB67_005577, partial [Kingdonia uniflora]
LCSSGTDQFSALLEFFLLEFCHLFSWFPLLVNLMFISLKSLLHQTPHFLSIFLFLLNALCLQIIYK